MAPKTDKRGLVDALRVIPQLPAAAMILKLGKTGAPRRINITNISRHSHYYRAAEIRLLPSCVAMRRCRPYDGQGTLPTFASASGEGSRRAH